MGNPPSILENSFWTEESDGLQTMETQSDTTERLTHVSAKPFLMKLLILMTDSVVNPIILQKRKLEAL